MGPNSLFWYICEEFIYRLPEPPIRKRTVPMEVLAVGLPRSATESLKEALLILGYKDCYHGYDLIFDGAYVPKWAQLVRQKHYPTTSRWSPYPQAREQALISAEEFDGVLGHCRAVIDSPASTFAYDLICAYPEAKVILNKRPDLDRWTQSVMDTFVTAGKHPVIRVAGWFETELFWMGHVYHHLIWPAVFGYAFEGASFDDGVKGKAKHINLEHSAMIRGAVPKERLLEWSVDQGWEPLCAFLGKPVPANTPFPNANTGDSFAARRDAIVKARLGRAFRNMALWLVVVSLLGVWYYKSGGWLVTKE